MMQPGSYDFLHRVVTRLTTVERVVDGNTVLWIYYALVLLYMIFDTYFRNHMYKLAKSGDLENDSRLVKFYRFYSIHGFILINIILFFVCMILTIYNEGFNFDFLITLTLSFVLFTLLMKILMVVFISEDSYKNGLFIRALHIVCYMILGSYFVFFVPFMKYPNLLLAYLGLIVGLGFCVYIMIQAIFNPEILRKNYESHEMYAEAFGILKGMLAVLVCILLLEYILVYGCFVTHPELYQTGEGRILNGWDMFYYLIISFTTIGYGDIYPIQVGYLFYSEFTAIVIGLTSMFTSACFVSAVISTANNIAQNNKKKKVEKIEDSFEKLLAQNSKKEEKT